MVEIEPNGGRSQLSAEPATISNEGFGPVTVAEQLQDLVLDSLDVGDFLHELSEYSASLASEAGGPDLDCAVTLYRRRRAQTGAGSSPRATTLNEIQQRMGAGPCITALEEQRTIVVDNTAIETRWPDYAQQLLAENIHSVLSVPLNLEQDATASLNFFSPTAHLFTHEMVTSAEQYACQAQKALRLAVRIGSQQQLAQDLQEAMNSRTVIDLAVGVIMGQQRCAQHDAFEILARASSTRNQKLRDLAQEVLSNLTNENIHTHFDT
ncbi:histidine kinase [Arthrobacter psychrolactophilus]|uniref:Histidine kinase n=1 Tax=Arthrobacter psychrolactophilus TaxID=92442 RepID=A0A2V5IWR1_9MICC|nr:GAF and ANTAR domain-containing protein [Arthrobacter psychrolactophilus]PYI38693.1 histidine kinase [Arthrobacter psychrolactophilus]